MNTGIEMRLKEIASRAWRERTTPNVYKTARRLADEQATVSLKVKAIVDRVRGGFGDYERGRWLDADEAVLAAATMCLSVGIRCRIVGARYGQGWTCWLAVQDEGQWITIDVLEGRLVGSDRKPDEQIAVECSMPYTADPGTESEVSAEGDIDGTCLMLGTVMQAVEAKKQDSNSERLARHVYDLLSSNRPPTGALGVDLVRPPNPAHGHAVAVLFADGKDVVIRFEEKGGK